MLDLYERPILRRMSLSMMVERAGLEKPFASVVRVTAVTGWRRNDDEHPEPCRDSRQTQHPSLPFSLFTFATWRMECVRMLKGIISSAVQKRDLDTRFGRLEFGTNSCLNEDLAKPTICLRPSWADLDACASS